MKLSHPLAIKPLALLGSWTVRSWLSTLDVRFAVEDPETLPSAARRRLIYLFWHEMMLLPAYTHVSQDVAMLVSRHRDGELIAQVIRMLRGRSVRGSTTRGGAAALRAMMRESMASHVAITPDGPRGPRRVVQPGAVYLAAKTGMPIVPVGLAFERCWRMGSWDHMALPRPGSRARGVVGPPIDVPETITREQMELVRRQVQQELDRVQARAEQLAAAGNPGDRLYSLSQVRRAEE